jgi:hypothetical protein
MTTDKQFNRKEQKFHTFSQWVTHASRVLTSHPDYCERNYRAICFDTLGRVCRNGGDFGRARDEGTFPIAWLWPDQVAELAVALPIPSGSYARRLVQHRQELLEHSNKQMQTIRDMKKAQGGRQVRKNWLGGFIPKKGTQEREALEAAFGTCPRCCENPRAKNLETCAVCFDTPICEKVEGSLCSYIITFKGVRYRGSSTVWHREHDGKRCDTMMESRFSEIWTKWRWENEHD